MKQKQRLHQSCRSYASTFKACIGCAVQSRMGDLMAMRAALQQSIRETFQLQLIKLPKRVGSKLSLSMQNSTARVFRSLPPGLVF